MITVPRVASTSRTVFEKEAPILASKLLSLQNMNCTPWWHDVHTWTARVQ